MSPLVLDLPLLSSWAWIDGVLEGGSSGMGDVQVHVPLDPLHPR